MPEPYEAPKGTALVGASSQTKDKVENAAKAAVCAGRVALVDAQRQMQADWFAFGQLLGAFSLNRQPCWSEGPAGAASVPSSPGGVDASSARIR
jgi:hypothetical protein